MKKSIFLLILFAYASVLHAREEGKLYAVLVGVSEYRQAENNLSYSHQDAIEMYNLLKLQTPVSNLTLLIDRQATKDSIVEATRRLFAKAQPEDQIIFFFSGHGNSDRFFTHDRELTFQTLQKLFKESRAKRKMILADACFSGTFRTSGAESPAPAAPDTDERVMLFLSSRSSQTSRESSLLKNGLFTYFLIAGMKGGADADRDRTITARELFDFVYPRVKEQSGGTQIPVMWGKFEDSMTIMNWTK
jgi:uncharacterized caspase-like protein